jgi:hypothetical protein
MDAQIPNHQNAQAAGGLKQVSAQTFAAKFQSKGEIYRFLTLDVKAYLPPFQTITVYFMKDLISAQKKVRYKFSSISIQIS